MTEYQNPSSPLASIPDANPASSLSALASEPARDARSGRVILVDDDEHIRHATSQTLLLRGIPVQTFANANQAVEQLSDAFDGIVISDIRMPGLDGIQFFAKIRAIDPDIPVILITGHGDVETAVQAMHDGAYDFLSKPFSAERLWRSVQRAIEKRQLMLENRRLHAHLQNNEASDILVGTSPGIQKIRKAIANLADANVDILIQGETGAGKDVAARALHESSRRRSRPFVAINCGALPESVIESELFGHEAGAFTGAQKRRVGRIEHASGGTLFLDEIESMPLALQVKLLRVLETRKVTPLGTNEERDLDLRVVAATKEDLGSEKARAFFRQDLYYRLNVVTLKLPALRDRPEDIATLFARFVDGAAKRFNRIPPTIDLDVLKYLRSQAWPGNVRELLHYAERFVLGVAEWDIDEGGASTPASTTGDERVDTQGLPAIAGDDAQNLPSRMEQIEAEIIRRTLKANQGDIKATLAALKIPRKTFYDKLQRHNISRSEYLS